MSGYFRWHWEGGSWTEAVVAQRGLEGQVLQLSTLQACVVLLFNDRDSLTFGEVHAATGIPQAVLKKTLASLSGGQDRQILLKDPRGAGEPAEGDVFTFNAGFTSKNYRVRLGTIMLRKEAEWAATKQKVEEDRKPHIDAAIVRLMKTRQSLDHQSIVKSVTQQLASRFLPQPLMIKQRLENLLERDFLERDAADPDLFHYKS